MQIPGAVTQELERMAPERVRVREPMSKHTSFGLGGPADIWLSPSEPGAFKDCAALLADERIPVLILGRGTNVLVRSGGIDGAVMVVADAFADVTRREDRVIAGSGAPLSGVLSFCAELGLSGLEGLAGIPGSLGGAVVTNAGSFGVSVGDRLAAIVVFEAGGRSRTIPVAQLGVGYRRTDVPDGSVIEAVELTLSEDTPGSTLARQQEMLERKWKTQPCGMRSAGCIFRNPPGQWAGKLIDTAGLKGTRIGGAVVSDRHADFILNDRGAVAEDVEELIEVVRARVMDTDGIELELEIEIIGRRAN